LLGSSPPDLPSAAGRAWPRLPCCGQPIAGPSEPAVVLRPSGHAAGLASPACAETLDVCGTAAGSPGGLGGDPCGGAAARAREPALGLPADRPEGVRLPV